MKSSIEISSTCPSSLMLSKSMTFMKPIPGTSTAPYPPITRPPDKGPPPNMPIVASCMFMSIIPPCLPLLPPDPAPAPAMANVPVGSLSKEQQDELLCTYAALVLHDDGAEVSPQGMTNLIKAAGCAVEGYWPMLMAKMIKNVGMDALIKMGSGAGGGGGGAAPASGGGAAAGGGGGDAGSAKEEKKKVEEVEEEEDMDFDLFG